MHINFWVKGDKVKLAVKSNCCKKFLSMAVKFIYGTYNKTFFFQMKMCISFQHKQWWIHKFCWRKS